MIVGLKAAGEERCELTQLAAEVAPAARFRFIAPQQVGQMRSIDRLVVTSQVSQQRQRFARFEGADRYTIPLDLARPEQPETVGRIHPSPFQRGKNRLRTVSEQFLEQLANRYAYSTLNSTKSEMVLLTAPERAPARWLAPAADVARRTSRAAPCSHPDRAYRCELVDSAR